MGKRYLLFIFLLFTAVTNYAQSVGDYQTVASGNWNTVAVWNTWNGTAWVVPGGTPNNTNGVITINAGHTITVPAALTVDQVIINGTVNLGATITLTIANGAGVDLQINGTFGDLSSASVVWNAGATWQMGAAGTLLKTTASSSNNWQSNYQGGISTIPSTSNWIIRKSATAQPALSSTTPATGSVYPNLWVECNTAAAWITPAGSSFTGSTAFVTIKGDLNVGGNGTNTVDFLIGNTNANPTLVMGNVNIKAGSNIRNYGTGFEVQGNLNANGSVTYDANDGRKILFSGSNNQQVNGAGALAVFDMTFSKTGGTVTLNRAVTVDNVATFSNGVVYSTSTNLLIIASAGSVTGASNTSFVSGPVRYMGNTGFTFPIGKNADYQPLGLGSYTPTTGAFWTETFNNGCMQGCLGSAYSGANGPWTMTLTGTNDASANQFFVSCAENGNAVGACGTGCGSNATLHVGNVSTSPAAFFFCPSGDCGAAYDAGLGSNQVRTDKRMESPTINCTGRASIYFNFKYIEGGAGAIDNATAWYFDGTTWAQVADMAKTVVCAGQGTWTAYSIALPASADNNPNVKIGFRWVNNDDGAGADPTIAVDDVTLATAPESFTAEYFYADPTVAYNNVLAASLSAIDACEYWILDRLPAASTAAATVLLNWDANTCPAIPLITDTRVAHFDGAMWQDEGSGGNTGTTTAGTVISTANVTYFSPFTIGLIPPTPLPIELLRFGGECNKGIVQLDWTTASEQNNDYFTIERSADGVTYATIGELDGAGNSTQLLNYSFTDTHAPAGTSYYRLRQTDFNGQFSYSPIVAINTSDCAEKNLTLNWVTTAGGDLNLSYAFAAGPVTVEVFSADGHLLSSNTDLPKNGTLSTPADWSTGVYFIRLSDGYSSVSRTIVK